MKSVAEVENRSAGAEHALDVAFLAAQTFQDTALQHELLDLFLAQAERLLPRLPHLSPRGQTDDAHRLRGACCGIGAWRAADAAQAYEDAGAADRPGAYAQMTLAFAEAEAAIRAHLAARVGTV